MRSANVQRRAIMVSAGALQQPSGSHVSHAQNWCRSPHGHRRAFECGVLSSLFHDGQRCALLTTKSRNTCTLATVFSSSG